MNAGVDVDEVFMDDEHRPTGDRAEAGEVDALVDETHDLEEVDVSEASAADAADGDSSDYEPSDDDEDDDM